VESGANHSDRSVFRKSFSKRMVLGPTTEAAPIFFSAKLNQAPVAAAGSDHRRYSCSFYFTSTGVPFSMS
jgi:hypothetical protein